MKFNKHYELEGAHAFLSPSGYHWLNYSPEKLMAVRSNKLAVEKGTELHAIAESLIKNKIKLPKSSKTLNAYVNDAIGYGMSPEVVLYYSRHCFGTADSILFDEKKSLLRIHDLKTGTTPAHMEQLEIYTALFCLEYGVRPSEIEMELRIYQFDEKQIFIPSSEDIVPKIDIIVSHSALLDQLEEKEN